MKHIFLMLITLMCFSSLKSQEQEITIILKDNTTHRGYIMKEDSSRIKFSSDDFPTVKWINKNEILNYPTIGKKPDLSLPQEQTNFQLERVDSVAKTKGLIYSDTKMFIAEYWKSAQNVIQNDDKENGIILVKGSISISQSVLLAVIEYTYSYTVKFLMKEGRYKIVIDNVNCASATNIKSNPPCIEFSENATYPGYGKTWLTRDGWAELMRTVKESLNGIADSYDVYIKKPSVSKDDW